MKPARSADSYVPVAMRGESHTATDWNSEQLILTLPDVARIMRCSTYTVRKRVRDRMFPPPDVKHPNMWKRDRLRLWFEKDKRVR